MRRRPLVAFATTLALVISAVAPRVVLAQDAPPPRSLDFEATTAPARLVQGQDIGAVFELSSEHAHSGERAGVLRLPAGGQTAATAVPLTAGPYRGRIVALSAWLRAEGQDTGLSGLWMRIDSPTGPPAFFDNMADRPVRSGDWSLSTIVADVPPDATAIVIGAIRSGGGSLWVDDLSFAVASKDALEEARSLRIAAYLDTALASLRRIHRNSDRLDWNAVQAEADDIVATAATVGDTYAFIREIIDRLGDRHTRFVPPSGAGVETAVETSPKPTLTASGDVALIVMPTLISRAGSLEAAGYETALRTFVSTRQCGFVLDLRDNRGGDMWPMLNGLAPLLDKGALGYFESSGGSPRPWGFDVSGRLSILNQAPPARSAVRPPVAILYGPRTASSGELVALSFFGAAATRSFGAETAGLTSANLPVWLSDGSLLSITGASVLDRDETPVTGALTPDEVAVDAYAAAARWLAQQGCHPE